ncbi:MAG: DUF3037 domain-containing protein [Caldilineaceae bacterium]
MILFCHPRRFLDACVELNRARLAALAPTGFDIEQAEAHLALIPAIARSAGTDWGATLADRFHWLTAPRSTVIQPSVIHCGRCVDPAEALDRLMNAMIRD